jgi:hypothetical protein
MTNKPSDLEAYGFTKELVEKAYERTITDKQWQMLIDFCEGEYSIPDSVDDFMGKADWLEQQMTEYEQILEQQHGKDWRDKLND